MPLRSVSARSHARRAASDACLAAARPLLTRCGLCVGLPFAGRPARLFLLLPPHGQGACPGGEHRGQASGSASPPCALLPSCGAAGAVRAAAGSCAVFVPPGAARPPLHWPLLGQQQVCETGELSSRSHEGAAVSCALQRAGCCAADRAGPLCAHCAPCQPLLSSAAVSCLPQPPLVLVRCTAGQPSPWRLAVGARCLLVGAGCCSGPHGARTGLPRRKFRPRLARLAGASVHGAALRQPARAEDCPSYPSMQASQFDRLSFMSYNVQQRAQPL